MKALPSEPNMKGGEIEEKKKKDTKRRKQQKAGSGRGGEIDW